MSDWISNHSQSAEDAAKALAERDESNCEECPHAASAHTQDGCPSCSCKLTRGESVCRVWQAWFKSGGDATPTATPDDVDALALFIITGSVESNDWKLMNFFPGDARKVARAYLAQQKRIAELRDGLREALAVANYNDGPLSEERIKALRALLEGT